MSEFRTPDRYAQLLSYAQSLTPPARWKIEISGDEIIMTAGPSAIHQRNLLQIREQFDAHRPFDMMPSENSDLASPNVGKLRNPDLTYIPLESSGNQIPAEQAPIAVEIVSPSNPENDLVGKVRDYPLMGIPLCLLIDPREGDITLCSEPSAGGHHQQWHGEFGDRVPIPAPFDFEFVTDSLVRYSV
ncbi:Uma2 family endonuclease [Kitasatospora aureofaciens]|uniref:Uma2 family endonuclease n=1 Tax=Kitasatospora aureofaciens TaxID=1894 RepID=UPI0005249DD5|nr:Uma2 family endonuclease [Kitasatospora aureofaciens]